MSADGLHPGELSGEGLVLRPSKYFHPSELACHDGTAYPQQWGVTLAVLFDMMDRIRGEFGKPLKVISGYRTPAYNQRVGGARLSQHVEGRAADLQPICPPSELESEVERLRDVVERLLDESKLPAIGGVGFYPGKWVHVDTRLKPEASLRVARWNGTGVGSEVA